MSKFCNSDGTENKNKELIRRIVFLALIGGACMLTYADRTNMGIVIVPLGDEFDWSARTRGAVLGSFFFGYIATQIVGGWLSDGVLGGSLVLLIGMLLWSILLILTPLVVRRVGLAGAIAVRIGLGLTEGVVFPAIHSMMPKMILEEWRNGAVAYLAAMVTAGGIVALLVAAPLAAYSGWTAVFYGVGGSGLLWSLMWSFWLLFDKKLHVTVRKEQGLVPIKGKQGPWKVLMSSSPVWAMFTCNYCNSWGFWQILTWLPTYFRDTYDTDLEHLGNLSVVPYIAQGVIGLSLGLLGDYVLRKRLIQKTLFRFLAQSIAMVGAASLLIALLFVKTQLSAVALIATAMSLNAFTVVGLNMNHFDLAPKQAGFLFAVGNSIAILPAVIGVPLTGWMLEASGHDWEGIFGLTAAHYVVGLVVWLIFGSTATVTP